MPLINFYRKSILQITLEQFGPLPLDRSRDMFVFRKCVSVRLFTVKTLLFPDIIPIHVTPRETHNELFLSPPIDVTDGSNERR